VFAVPNPIFSQNAAVPNDLIKKGAIPVESARDILSALRWDDAPSPEVTSSSPNLSDEETEILEILSREPTPIDDVIRGSRLDTKLVLSTLSIMELKGLVKRIERNQYIRL